MRSFLVTAALMSTLISPCSWADTSTKYNVVNLQAEATQEVSNDLMHAVLYVEKSHKQPATLASQINQLMNQAMSSAKAYSTVKIETGTQSTYPIYENDSQKLKEWRSRAEIRLESADFKTLSQLTSELQQWFQTESIYFTVSDQQRQKVENALILEVSKNFQQRAQLVAQSWNKSGYQLLSFHLNTQNYGYQPLMMSAARLKGSSADAIPEQNVAAGESKLTITATGEVQLK